MSAKRLKRTTTTKIVEALRAPGVEFMSIPQLKCTINEPTNRVTAALHALRRHHVVDVVVEKDGAGWWFALPKEEDTRCFSREEIADGIRRPRRAKVKRIT